MKQSLWCALQPIVDTITGRVVAHEALLRGPRNTPWESPQALFRSAQQLHECDLLEFNARRLAIRRQKDLPSSQILFMNVNASNPDLPLGLEGWSDPLRLAIEVSEQQPIVNNPALLEQVLKWRKAGHPIVLDDYGAGYMGPGAVLSIRPDVIKIDRQLIEAIDRDQVRRVLVSAIVQTARMLGILLIGEGVETFDEFVVLRKIGVRYMQGYFFAKPSPDPCIDAFKIPDISPDPITISRHSSAMLPIF